ncbi:hypothetical protein Tco_0071540 [Tanacetum coccineum]
MLLMDHDLSFGGHIGLVNHSFVNEGRVCVPAVCMVSAVWLPLSAGLNTFNGGDAGVVMLAYTSIYAAELVFAVCYLLAGWSLPLVTSFLLVVSNPAGVTMYLLLE